MVGGTAVLPLSRLFNRPDLLHGALFRLLVRTPAQKFCPVPETSTREVIVLELAHQFGLQRKPFCIAGVARPAAGTARSLAGKPFATHKWLQNRLQLLALFPGKAGAEADVIKLAILVVEAQQQ